MLGLLPSRNTRLLGMDISTNAIKLLELSKTNDRHCVEGYSVVPLPPESIADHLVADIDTVTAAVMEAVKNSNTSCKKVAVALPDAVVMTKTLQMDAALKDEDIEQQLVLEAEKHIPYPVEEINLDFELIGPNENNPDLIDVLLVASRTEYIETRVSALSEAGLDVKVVDVASYSMERACSLVSGQMPSMGIDKTVAVVDMGATLTNLTVLSNFKSIFFREEVFGGAQLTRDIQRHYNMDFNEAGRAKKVGDLPDDYQAEVLAPFQELAVLQIRRALQFFFSVSQNSKIDIVLLVGGTMSMEGFPALIEEQLGIPTQLANPFLDMKVSKNVNLNRLNADASALMTCCGLALRSFNDGAN